MKVKCDVTIRKYITMGLDLPEDFDKMNSITRYNILREQINPTLSEDESLAYVENSVTGDVYMDD